MKVLHLISSGGMYGAEAVILNLCRELGAQGHQSALGAFANADLTVYERALAEGIDAHKIPCRGPLDPSLPRSLRSLVSQTGAEIVHTHGYKPDVYASLALRGRIPLVATCHTWYDNDRAVRLYGWLDRRLLRGFDSVVAVSEAVVQRLRTSGVPAERIRRIGNGIDVERFAAAAEVRQPGDTLHVGLVGRLAPEKGVDIFLEAAARVHRARPQVRFSVFGEGPDRPSLEQRRTELGLTDIVAMPGAQSSMPAVYAGLDLLVSASRDEGLPIALLEGMAGGLAVVATRVGEVPTVVEDGRTGLLTQPNDPEALAAAILTLLDDPAKRQSFGRAGLARVRDWFSVQQMAAEYLSLYKRALEEGRHA